MIFSKISLSKIKRVQHWCSNCSILHYSKMIVITYLLKSNLTLFSKSLSWENIWVTYFFQIFSIRKCNHHKTSSTPIICHNSTKGGGTHLNINGRRDHVYLYWSQFEVWFLSQIDSNGAFLFWVLNVKKLKILQRVEVPI